MDHSKKHDLALISKNLQSQSQQKQYIDLHIPTFEELQRRKMERMNQERMNQERMNQETKKQNMVLIHKFVKYL